ncbi:MAG: hypothetical protein FJ357_04050 [Thaumarchaeota archaeon]|nr:hypothetical protein [Nitrososphaerota archaeon]
MASSIHLVFSNYGYVILAGMIFSAMFMVLSALSEFVFFEPYFIFYVPDDRTASFALLITVSVMSALVIPMNVYLVRLVQKVKRASGGVVGSIIGASAGACSCGPVGFSIISTFGTVGGTATAFLTTYEMPLRLLSLGILGIAYYQTTRSLRDNCRIKN